MSRVLVVSFAVAPAPNEQGVYLDHLLTALGSRYAVDAMTVRGGELPHVQRYRNARMLRVPVAESPASAAGPTTSAQVQAFRRAVRRQLEGNDYDVIHACGPEAAVAVCEARGVEAKLVYDPDAAGDCAEGSRERAKAQRLCLERAALVVVHSGLARDEVLAARADARVVVVRPGVDVDLFDWEQIPLPRVPRVLYHGAVAPGCGLELLLAALPRVIARRRALLWIVGPGDPAFFDALRACAAGLGVADRVEFFGAMDHAQLPRVLAVGSVGVVPAVRGGRACPLKALELAACRKALVVVRHPVVDEILEPGVDVASFAPGSAEELADAILGVLSDSARRERLAAAGYRRVREEHTASSTRRAILAAYLGLAPPLPLPKGPQAPDTAAQTLEVMSAGAPDSLATIPNLPVLPLERNR